MEELTKKVSSLKVTECEKPKYPVGRRTAYIYFSQQVRNELRAKGESVSIGQSSKICSQRWKQASKKEKEKYERKSAEDGVRYDVEMLEYEKQKALYDKWVDKQFDSGDYSQIPSIFAKASKKTAAIVKETEKPAKTKKPTVATNANTKAEAVPKPKEKTKTIASKKEKEEKAKPVAVVEPKGKQKQANQKKAAVNNKKKAAKHLFDEIDDESDNDPKDDSFEVEEKTLVAENTFVVDGQVNENKYIKKKPVVKDNKAIHDENITEDDSFTDEEDADKDESDEEEDNDDNGSGDDEDESESESADSFEDSN